MNWMDYVDWNKIDEQGHLDEDSFWDAMAEDMNVDVSEISDRDPLEFL